MLDNPPKKSVTLLETSGVEESAIVLVTQVSFLFMSLAIQSMLAWMLAPEGRGAYAVCFLFGTIFGVIFTLGTDRASQYFVMSKKLTLSEGVSVALIIAFIGSVLAMLLGWVLINTDFSFFQKADQSAFEIALCLIPLTVLVTILQLHLAGLRKFARLGVMTVLQAAICLGLVFVFVFVLDLGVNGALAAQAVSLILVACALLFELRRNCGLVLVVPKWQHFQTVLSYGFRYYVARVGNLVDQQMGAIILAIFATREEIGLFAAASTLALKVLMFPQSIESSMLPRISADPSGKLKHVGQAVRISGMLTGFTMIVLTIFSYPLVLLVLSPDFLSSVPLIWILAPGIIIQGCTHILMAYFRAVNRPGVISWAIFVGLSVNACTVISLYSEIGVTAAAWGMTFGFISQAIIVFSMYYLITKQSISRVLLPQREDLTKLMSLFNLISAKISQSKAHR